MHRMTDIHEGGVFSPTYIPEFTTPEEFIKAKLEILRKHMQIELTDEDIAHLREYRTEYEINAAVKGILNKYWK